jgi:hypothetical protein
VVEPEVDYDFMVIPGDQLRDFCKQFVGCCAAFMTGSRLCGALSHSWVENWSRGTLAALKKGEIVDSHDYLHDEAVPIVRKFFVAAMKRRMDGPDDKGKNAVLKHLTKVALKDLNLGLMEV